MGNHSKRLLKALRSVRGLMWIKRSIPLALLTVWTVVLVFLIWWKGMPDEWSTETVRFAQMREVTTRSMSRWGTNYHHYDVLVTEDGREFRFREGEKVLLPLSAAEECHLVYEGNGDRVMFIRALSTADDGVLIALADSINAHRKMVSLLWWILAAGVALCLMAWVLVEVFGMKMERALIAKLQSEIVRLQK